MKGHQAAVVDFFSALRPGRVLDAGSGGDTLGGALKGMGFEVFSLDLYSGTSLRGRFVRADLNSNLPFIDNAFDYVLCSESLQYLENHALLFREFKRVLKAGGSAVLSTPNVLSAASRMYFMRRGYYPHFKPVRTVDAAKGWDDIAYNPVSLVDVSELALRSGFEVKAVRASGKRLKGIAGYVFIKALYSLGLLLERHEGKKELIRNLSSADALLGDHLIIELKSATRGRGA